MARFWQRGTSRSSDEFTHDQEPPLGRNWLVLAGYLLACLVVAVLIVFGARTVYRAVHDNNTASNSSNETTPPESGTAAAPPGANSSVKPPPSPNNLPNNGPGDVIALFIGTALAAGGLHYIVTGRRS